MAVADRASQELWTCHLGVVGYRDALSIQEQLRARRHAGELPDTLLLLEHPPVYTRGRRSGAEDLPLSEDYYRARGIDVIDTDRGGKLTYHGPGQLVGYPIMRVEDIGAFLRTMEGAIVAALAEEGVRARSRHEEGIDYTGVWVGERKIASIGLHVSRGISTHGFAVNVENDLEPFSRVIACGLPGVEMTSIAAELARTRPDTGKTPIHGGAGAEAGDSRAHDLLERFRGRMACSFALAHGKRHGRVSPWRVGIDTTNPAGRATERAPIKSSSSQREAVPA